ncbi:MAG: MFS transporter [Puniceicoccaceae bacterium]|nr:MAG: MFS transporter [Puniceicoccaceae bacterium]
MRALKKSEILNYSIGDFGINLNFQLLGFFLAYFYTDVFGISPWHASFIFLIARAWDAINDPLMGLIADRTKNRWGTYKPYIFWGAIPLNLILIACFSIPELSSSMQVIYCYFTYILHGMIFTAVGLPYSAIGTLVTQDQQERAKISTMRMFFAVIIVITVVGSYVTPFVNSQPIIVEFVGVHLMTLQGPQFSDEADGWFTVAVIFGIISTLILFYSAMNTQERVHAPVQKYKLSDIKTIIFKNDVLLILSASMFLNTAIWVVQNAVSFYYFKYVAQIESLQTIFFQWMLPANIIGVILTPILTARLGKKNVFILGSLIVFLVNVTRHFIPIPTLESYTLFIGLSMLGSSCMMFCSICQWGMVPDTIEYGQWKTGIRSEGIPLSFFSFMQKLAMSFGGFFALQILAFTGYVANTELPESALNGIQLLYNIFPGLFSLGCLVFLLYYKLSKEKYDTILAELQQKSKSAQD